MYLAAASMKIPAIWAVALLSLVEDYQHFRYAYYFWNISKLLPDYTVKQPRWQLHNFYCIVYTADCYQ
jgi:hypothetical protein